MQLPYFQMDSPVLFNFDNLIQYNTRTTDTLVNRVKESQNMFSQLHSNASENYQSQIPFNIHGTQQSFEDETIHCYQIPKCISLETKLSQNVSVSNQDLFSEIFNSKTLNDKHAEEKLLEHKAPSFANDHSNLQTIPDLIILHKKYVKILAEKLNVDYKFIVATIESIIKD